MTQPRIIDLFRASGDASIGQTLARLARLAESAHRFERADDLRASHAAHAADSAPHHLSAPAPDSKESMR